MDDLHYTSQSLITQGFAQGQNLAALFFKQVQKTPNKIALYVDDQAISYKSLASKAIEMAHVLHHAGVRHGDHIAVLLPNDVHFVTLMLAAADTGVVMVPLNTSITPQAMLQAFKAADVKHVIGSARLLTPILESVGSSIIEGIWLCVDEPIAGAISLQEKRHEVGALAMPFYSGEWQDTYILTMTSGSTGDPKPIVLTQDNKRQRAAAAVKLYNISAQDITLAATPLYHSLAERLVLLPLITGGTSVLMAKFSVETWLTAVAQYQVSFSIAVSSQLNQIAIHLASNLDEAKNRLNSLRCLVSSSALLEEPVKASLINALSCEFHECYGASEVAIVSNLNPIDTYQKLGSVGKAAPDVDIKIINDQGITAEVGEIGEIVCKTPMLFKGYYKRPDLTAMAMLGNYFKTGDLGKLDADGFLYFIGRKKDLIISGGINIYPSDIEAVLAKRDDLIEYAAFAAPDEKLGEVVALALVVKDQGTFDLRALRHFCAAELADFQQPRKFYFLEQLPRNSLGKLTKFKLAEICV